MVRIKIQDNKETGFQETALIPGNSGNLSTLKLGRMTHFANRTTGRLLLSVDTVDQAVNYCDPSVMIEHTLDGAKQFFQGNFISLKPKK